MVMVHIIIKEDEDDHDIEDAPESPYDDSNIAIIT